MAVWKKEAHRVLDQQEVIAETMREHGYIALADDLRKLIDEQRILVKQIIEEEA